MYVEFMSSFRTVILLIITGVGIDKNVAVTEDIHPELYYENLEDMHAIFDTKRLLNYSTITLPSTPLSLRKLTFLSMGLIGGIFFLLIAALIFSAGYYCAPIFLQFKEFELYWGAVFFLKICSHIFIIFEVKLE